MAYSSGITCAGGYSSALLDLSTSVGPRFNDPWPRPNVKLQTPPRAEECNTVVRSVPVVEMCGCKLPSSEHCSQIKHPTGNASGQHVTAGQCCFEPDRPERLYYEGSLRRGRIVDEDDWLVTFTHQSLWFPRKSPFLHLVGQTGPVVQCSVVTSRILEPKS
jgi:hypothetical protein